MALTKVIGDGLGGTNDLTVDTTTLTVDATNNRVGVGTASPDANLQVGGALDSAGSYRGALALKTQTVGSITPGEAALYIEETSGGEGYYVGVDSTGGMFFNNSGSSTTLQLGDDGAVTMPNQPAFLATPSSSQDNVAVGSDVTVVFGTEIFDQNSDFASNTFTAPITGKYQLQTSVRVQDLDASANFYFILIKTSNRNYINIVDPDFGQDNGYFTFTLSALADMDANDTAYVIIYVSGTGAVQADINNESAFSGYLVA